MGPSWCQIWSKTYYIPKVSNFYLEKRIPMLTDLKVSSLGCKCVFYRPNHNATGDPLKLDFAVLKMQK